MKKFRFLFLLATLIVTTASPVSAVEFTAKGQWAFNFDYGQHGNFTTGNGRTGFNQSSDPFNAEQRLRLQFDAIASESLSGTLYFEIGTQRWGQASTGAALGTDGTRVEVKNAYIDWSIPDTTVKLRMGLQNVTLPGFSNASQVLSADMGGITASWRYNDTVSLTALWIRPWNDNYSGNPAAGSAGNNASRPAGWRANYLDNVDIAGLLLPLTFDGIKVTPWALYGAIGPNAQRNDANTNPYLPSGTSYYQSGLYPLYGSTRHEKLTGYGSAAWLGLTGEVTALAPWRIAWDFTWGSMIRDDSSSNRTGWLASTLVEYTLDWATPGLYGWYGSGDDNNPGNGSERLPYTNLDDGGTGSFDTFAFNGARANSFRDSLLGHSLSGTWGVGARLKDMRFVENMKHSLRVNYIGGTNDPGLLKALYRRTGTWMAPNGDILGKEGMYLTRNDSALSVGLNNEYALYTNLTLCFDLSYIALWLDKSSSVWGSSRMNGKSDAVHDAWNMNVNVIYSF